MSDYENKYDYENEYEVTIKTITTYTFKTMADDDLYALAEAFEKRFAWQLEDEGSYKVSVKKVEQ